MAAKGYVVLYPNPRAAPAMARTLATSFNTYPGDDYKDLMAAWMICPSAVSIAEKKWSLPAGSGGGSAEPTGPLVRLRGSAAAVSLRGHRRLGPFWYVAGLQRCFSRRGFANRRSKIPRTTKHAPDTPNITK